MQQLGLFWSDQSDQSDRPVRPVGPVHPLIVKSFKISNEKERYSRGKLYDVAGVVLPEGFQIYGLDK